MQSHGFNWDAHPEVTAKLTELWNGGMSAGNIAKTLGNELTRCAIIGKVHRLGLPSHGPGKSGHPSKPKQAVVPKPKPVIVPPPEKPTAVLPPETFGNDRQCKFIDGDPCSPDWQMCGNPVKSDKQYCEYHWGKTVDLARTAQVRAAQR